MQDIGNRKVQEDPPEIKELREKFADEVFAALPAESCYRTPPPVPDRMTSLPRHVLGVSASADRAATASRLSRLASSSAKLASTNAGRT